MLTGCNCVRLCAAGKLLAKEPELKANFSRAQGAASNAKANKVARFLPNPEANWGPKPKHGRPVKVCTCVSYTNQSLGLGSPLPGHCLAVSAILFTVFVCGQSCPRFVAMSPAPFKFFVCGHCNASLPGKCMLQCLWLCSTCVCGVRKAPNSALSCLSAYCTAETG